MDLVFHLNGFIHIGVAHIHLALKEMLSNLYKTLHESFGEQDEVQPMANRE